MKCSEYRAHRTIQMLNCILFFLSDSLKIKKHTVQFLHLYLLNRKNGVDLVGDWVKKHHHLQAVTVTQLVIYTSCRCWVPTREPFCVTEEQLDRSDSHPSSSNQAAQCQSATHYGVAPHSPACINVINSHKPSAVYSHFIYSRSQSFVLTYLSTNWDLSFFFLPFSCVVFHPSFTSLFCSGVFFIL